MNLRKLIDSGQLFDSGSPIACPNCEGEANLYWHQYDNELTGLVCGACNHVEWVNSAGSKDNPRKCPECSEFVTDEELEGDKAVQCSAFDSGGESSCDQLAHRKCADACSKCGWLCHREVGAYLTCDSCGLKHFDDHFVSLGSDFTSEFGQICQNCFDKEESHPPEVNPSQLHAEPETFVRNREDQSAYLTHFIRKRSTMTEDQCFEQLIKILSDEKLEARPTGYFSIYDQIPNKSACSKAVCFTEGRLAALVDHAKAYSPFGVSFSKFNLLKHFKAAPAVYIHDELIKTIRANIPDVLVPYVNTIRADGYNFQHEREWRVPQDLLFKQSEIRCIFAPKRFHNKLRVVLGDEAQIVCLDSLTHF